MSSTCQEPAENESRKNGDEAGDGTETLLQSNESIKHLDDVLSDIKFGWFHLKLMFLVGSTYFAVCAELMVMVFLSKPVKDEWQLDNLVYPWLKFCSGIGGMVGGFIFGTISDRYGRKKPFIISLAILAVSGILSAFPPVFPVLILFRTFIAIGTGGIEAVAFVLLLEFLPRRNRGTCMVAITFCGALGAVLTGGLAWWLLPSYGWRYLVGACAVPALLVFILQFFLIYESPRFLYISGNTEAGKKVLETIAAQNKTVLPSGEITCPPSERRGRILDLFNDTLRKRTFFITLVWFIQAFGYWGVTFHLPEYIGSQGVDPYFNMFTVFIGELPGMCLAMILIENHMLGRVKCLRFFSIFTSISLLLFGFVNVDFLKAVFVVVCYFFMVPIYSILNTFTPEIYPTEVRSTALAWVNIVIEIPAMISPFIAASMLSSTISWLYPTVWASCFLLQFLMELGLNLETAGQDLKDTTLKKVDGSTSTTTSL